MPDGTSWSLKCLGTVNSEIMQSLRCFSSESGCLPNLFACCEACEIVQSFHMSLDDDVRKLQRSERHSETGVANKSEGDIMKKG